MTLGMEHSQILELQTLQIEPSDKSDNLYKLVWMRVEPIFILVNLSALLSSNSVSHNNSIYILMKLVKQLINILWNTG